VGERIAYEIVVSNLSARDLEGVVLEDQYDSGLEHQAGPAPLRWEIGTLPAGATRTFPIRFTVREAGEQCHELTVRAADGNQASSRACITAVRSDSPPAGPAATPASPAVRVQIQGPQQSRIGQQEVFEFVVENVGGVPLTDVQVQATFDAELQAKETAPEARRTGENGAVWTISTLAVGAQQRLRVRCDVVRGRERACVEAIAASRENARDTRQWCVELEALQFVPAPEGLRGTEQPDLWSPQEPGNRPQVEGPAGSGLTLRVARQESPFSAERGNLLFRIELTNLGNSPHSDVTLRISVPENSDYVSSQGPPAVDLLEVSPDRSQLLFRPIVTLRPSESVSFQVEVRPLAASIGKMSAEVTSVEDRTGISVTEP
jgi:hypothetical protein